MAKHNHDGESGEQQVAKFLKDNKYKILNKNWKTPKCEIDLVAKKDNCIYFVEVKYRSNENQGSGFDYITSSKLKHMTYAAESWLQSHDWQGESSLAVAEVLGDNFEINFINQI